MTFTPQEIEELKRDGWDKTGDHFEKSGRLGGKWCMWSQGNTIYSTYHYLDFRGSHTFSTLQELREFFGLGVEG